VGGRKKVWRKRKQAKIKEEIEEGMRRKVTGREEDSMKEKKTNQSTPWS
jgi:hypothetical protein